MFHLRTDPFESYDSTDSYGHLPQTVSWVLAPMSEVLGAHLRTLVQYPPVQGGKSFDMSDLVRQTLQKARQ